MNQPAQTNWWGRNWKWVVPVGLGVPVLGVGGLFTVIVLVFGIVKHSDVYTEALAAAKSDPAVIAVLGAPIEEGFLVLGEIQINGSGGWADVAIPISGPKGTGTVYAVARKSGGYWEYETLEVAVEGRHGRVDLLADY